MDEPAVGSTSTGEIMDGTSSSTSGGLDMGATDESTWSPAESTDTSTDGGAPPDCGDAVVDEGEECDDRRETARCDDDCTFVSCGDGIVNATAGEACDDAGESATCDIDCTPVACGDGLTNLAAGEVCDDGGESSGCDVDCTPAACGDGTFNASHGEECDDSGATPTCDDDCTLVGCGDGTLNALAGEECDDGGESMLCNSDCTTRVCGDGIANVTAGEECDDNGPSLSCDLDCTVVECGDLVVNAISGEQCDGADLGGATCNGMGFEGGSLACDASCQLDVSGCFACGDGMANPGEACDGADLGGATCVTQGFDGGTLGCSAGCIHETSQCYVDPVRCLDIHTIDPAAPSGTYEIDVDGAGPLPAFLAYCDMDTDGGGWTELTLALGCTLGAELVPIDGAAMAGLDTECRPYTRDEADGHTHLYMIPFPAGFSQIMPVDYVAHANAGPGDVSDLDGAFFVQTSWGSANGGSRGDISFGAAEDLGPVVSFASAGYPSTMCLACDLVFPGNGTIYTLPGERHALQLGWGENGGEHEGWYPWWSGTFRVR